MCGGVDVLFRDGWLCGGIARVCVHRIRNAFAQHMRGAARVSCHLSDRSLFKCYFVTRSRLLLNILIVYLINVVIILPYYCYAVI